jgi:hypothetical protein
MVNKPSRTADAFGSAYLNVMRFWSRPSPLTLMVAAFIASVAGWAMCDLLLQGAQSIMFIGVSADTRFRVGS